MKTWSLPVALRRRVSLNLLRSALMSGPDVGEEFAMLRKLRQLVPDADERRALRAKMDAEAGHLALRRPKPRVGEDGSADIPTGKPQATEEELEDALHRARCAAAKAARR